jgi:hypothetical protein
MRAERIEKLEAANRRLTSSRKAIAAGEAAGTAIGALAVIMSDRNVPMSKRLQAAENLLAYKTPQDVAESAKQFLASVFLNPEENIDHRLAATTALRRFEDPKIALPTERPAPAHTGPAEEPPEPLHILVERQRARCGVMQAEMVRECALQTGAGRNGNGADS